MARQAVSFTEGEVGLQLYRMSLPMVWGLLATMSFNAVDTFFVAQLGSDPLAAMSFTFPVVMVVTSLGIGLGAGTSSVIARLLGRGCDEDAHRVATDTLLLSALLALAVMVIGWVAMDTVFRLLGADANLLPLIRQYMGVWYLSVPGIVMPMALSAVLRASGHASVAGGLMLASAICNALLDPLLIFGLGPVPALGIAGAAWATVLTRWVFLLAALWYVARRLHMLSLPRLASCPDSWRQVLHIGLPAMGTNMIIPAASGITVALVASHGVDAVAGYGVAVRIEPVVLIMFYALSSVIGPFLGQNMTETHRPRQRQALAAVSRFCLLSGVLLALLLGLLGETLAGWFSDSAEVVAIASRYLLLVPISYGCYGLVMCVNASFNGLGMPLPAMAVSLLRVLVLYLPLALFGQWLWGVYGLFVATATANVLAALVGYQWLRKRLLVAA